MARQTKYEKIIVPKLPAIELWAERGFTDVEICKSLGIAESTLNLYKEKHPEFKEFLQRAKLRADFQMTDSLFKRGTGYDFTEEFIEYIPASDGSNTKIKVVKKYKKHQPADTMANMYWHNNRQPNKWRHKSKDNIPIVEETPREFDDMTDEELIAFIEKQEKKKAEVK